MLFVFPLFLPVIVFLVSAYEVRNNKYNARRSLALCVLSILLAIGFTIEIVGGEELLSVFGRLIILLYPVSAWNVLQGNRIVKRLLGAPS